MGVRSSNTRASHVLPCAPPSPRSLSGKGREKVENTTNTSKVWDIEHVPLYYRILDYIERNGPTKTSRLRDALKKDTEDIQNLLIYLQADDRIVGVKPAQVYIWALPETVRSTEEEILSRLSGRGYIGLEHAEICTGSNKDQRLFREGVLMRLVRKGKVETSITVDRSGIYYNLPEVKSDA